MSKWNQVYLYKPEILPLFLQLLSWYPGAGKNNQNNNELKKKEKKSSLACIIVCLSFSKWFVGQTKD